MSVDTTVILASELDEFAARCDAERRAEGKADVITDEGVYRLLDGLLARGTDTVKN